MLFTPMLFTLLPIFTVSLFDKYQCMIKPNKAALGTYLKDLLKTVEYSAAAVCIISSLMMDDCFIN